MEWFSEIVFLQLKMPMEEVQVSDEKRIGMALNVLGYVPVSIPLQMLRKLYPLCRDAGFDISMILVHRENDWVMTGVEPGDTRQNHYGLAVDYGSTTIVMELIDMNSGAVIDQVKATNGQKVFGADILTRIVYTMEASEHREQIQRATGAILNEPDYRRQKNLLRICTASSLPRSRFF